MSFNQMSELKVICHLYVVAVFYLDSLTTIYHGYFKNQTSGASIRDSRAHIDGRRLISGAFL